MSRTWRNSWGTELKFRESRGQRNSWKRGPHPDLILIDDMKEEAVSDNLNVFIIINEWDVDDDNTSSEVTGGKWFDSEDEAWSALNVIAESYGMILEPEETSFRLSATESLQSEEYRIEELTRG